MCDKCPCSSFSPHLWKPGECRDCHHPIGEHAIVSLDTSALSLSLSSSSSDNLSTTSTPETKTHTFVGKLSVDKLEPFSHPTETNPLVHSGSLGLQRPRSTTFTPPLHHDLSASRLSVNNNNIHNDTTRLQPPRPDSKGDGAAQPLTMRRSQSFKGIGVGNTESLSSSPGTYEQRLSASFRKSREIQAKRKSSTDVVDNSKEAHRGMIIEELVVTERDYCRDLDYLIQMIVEPLGAKGLLDRNDIAGIFSNIQEIRAVNTALLQQLEQSANLSAQTVGEIFSKMSAFFKCYSKYCTNHINSLNILRERKKMNQELALYLKTLKFNANSGKLGVEDYLIKPIQRICKYPLFFNQLIGCTAPGGKDYIALTEANSQMQKVATHVNDFHRDAENMNRVYEIQTRVHGKPFSLVSSHRRFICEQLATIKTLEEPTWNSRNIFLFSDILLYSKPPSKFSKRESYVGCIELDTVTISESKNELSLDKQDGTPLLKLMCLTDKEKAHWMGIMHTAISDTSSKRMSLQQALKETSNGQHESKTDLLRRQSSRNSIVFDTDEIMNRRNTLRRVDANVFAKFSAMNVQDNEPKVVTKPRASSFGSYAPPPLPVITTTPPPPSIITTPPPLTYHTPAPLSLTTPPQTTPTPTSSYSTPPPYSTPSSSYSTPSSSTTPSSTPTSSSFSTLAPSSSYPTLTLQTAPSYLPPSFSAPPPTFAQLPPPLIDATPSYSSSSSSSISIISDSEFRALPLPPSLKRAATITPPSFTPIPSFTPLPSSTTTTTTPSFDSTPAMTPTTTPSNTINKQQQQQPPQQTQQIQQQTQQIQQQPLRPLPPPRKRAATEPTKVNQQGQQQQLLQLQQQQQQQQQQQRENGVKVDKAGYRMSITPKDAKFFCSVEDSLQKTLRERAPSAGVSNT